MVAKGENGKGERSAAGVAERWRAKLPEGCTYKLTGKSLIYAAQHGRCGKPKGRTGPTSRVIDPLLVKGVAEHIQVQQLSGNEMKPRQILQVASALVTGTGHEEMVSDAARKRYLLAQVRKEWGMAVCASTVIDDRRWQWLHKMVRGLHTGTDRLQIHPWSPRRQV